jgi:hypothetical protein
MALEQIGRELRKMYRRPQRLPRRLRALVTRLEPKSRQGPGDGAGGLAMAQVDEIRRLVSESRSRIAEDRAALRRMAQKLSYTDQVVERATLAYNVSLWTLEKIERSQSNSRLNARNPPPPHA